jgi:hypothetical protein
MIENLEKTQAGEIRNSMEKRCITKLGTEMGKSYYFLTVKVNGPVTTHILQLLKISLKRLRAT